MRLEIAAVISCLLAVDVLMRLGMRLYDFTVAVSVVITVADVLVDVGFLSTDVHRAFPSTTNQQKTKVCIQSAGPGAGSQPKTGLRVIQRSPEKTEEDAALAPTLPPLLKLTGIKSSGSSICKSTGAFGDHVPKTP